MSVPRLTFLYPHLFRSLRITESSLPKTPLQSLRNPHQCSFRTRPRKRNFHTSRHNNVEFVERHGKAVEPFIPEGQSAADLKVFIPEENKETTAKEENVSSSAPLSEETQAAAYIPGDDGREVIYDVAPPPKEDSSSPKTPKTGSGSITSTEGGPIETVLQMPAPETQEKKEGGEDKPPHLQAPPYVHHFDTYTLVQQVGAGGFTNEQSVTAMKAVRGLLALNLDVAREGLVSKSDVENETYLFRAACSELKTEIQNNRKKQEEAMRRERTLLQHEVDILNQKLTQELLILKDDLKGMFDDRRMTVRSEQRAMESKIQELNYKITVGLNSDSKSEVEGLRWVLTRRSVMGILFMAFMVLTSLRYASWKHHEIEQQKKMEKEHSPPKEVIIEELPAQGAAEILAAN